MYSANGSYKLIENYTKVDLMFNNGLELGNPKTTFIDNMGNIDTKGFIKSEKDITCNEINAIGKINADSFNSNGTILSNGAVTVNDNITTSKDIVASGNISSDSLSGNKISLSNLASLPTDANEGDIVRYGSGEDSIIKMYTGSKWRDLQFKEEEEEVGTPSDVPASDITYYENKSVFKDDIELGELPYNIKLNKEGTIESSKMITDTLKLRPINLESDLPSNPMKGEIIITTYNDKFRLRIWNGSLWKPLDFD